MSNIEVKQLVTCSRFPDYKLFSLILYLPFGLLLLTLRIILGIALLIFGYILSDAPVSNKIVNKLACLTFGISVTVENPEKKEKVDVYISNSLSIFDQLVLHSSTGSVTPVMKAGILKSKALGSIHLGPEPNSETFKKNLHLVMSETKTPIHFTPEGKITNGKALLKFKSYPFQFAAKMQPVCIAIDRPFLDIALTTCGSSYYGDFFYFMFSPLTNYTLTFLSPLEKKSLSDVEFAEIVRQNLASGLKVQASELSASDVIEWEKRKIAEEQRVVQSQGSINRLVNSELERMTYQVKEVLPHVPFNAIYNDISVTRSVDNTITNILDGRVYFVPEQFASSVANVQPSTSSFPSSNVSSTPSSGDKAVLFNAAASTFSKSPKERIRSYQERKHQLLANARRRYIEKHNLNISF